ncbi:hypothetical protein [Streptomyces albospinus]|nr:hypothetical protein [Streptomyces albospinus]
MASGRHTGSGDSRGAAATRIPGARLVTVEGAGPLVHEDRPGESRPR